MYPSGSCSPSLTLTLSLSLSIPVTLNTLDYKRAYWHSRTVLYSSNVELTASWQPTTPPKTNQVNLRAQRCHSPPLSLSIYLSHALALSEIEWDFLFRSLSLVEQSSVGKTTALSNTFFSSAGHLVGPFVSLLVSLITHPSPPHHRPNSTGWNNFVSGTFSPHFSPHFSPLPSINKAN